MQMDVGWDDQQHSLTHDTEHVQRPTTLEMGSANASVKRAAKRLQHISRDVVPGVGFEPTLPCGKGGSRLHSHVRDVRLSPFDLLTSTAHSVVTSLR